MENWSQILGKRIKLIFRDGYLSGNPHYSHKVGILKSKTGSHLFIETERGLEGIQISVVLRFEVLNV